eukprot:1695880-Pyramimonas_sp.AAC.1
MLEHACTAQRHKLELPDWYPIRSGSWARGRVLARSKTNPPAFPPVTIRALVVNPSHVRTFAAYQTSCARSTRRAQTREDGCTDLVVLDGCELGDL